MLEHKAHKELMESQVFKDLKANKDQWDHMD